MFNTKAAVLIAIALLVLLATASCGGSTNSLINSDSSRTIAKKGGAKPGSDSGPVAVIVATPDNGYEPLVVDFDGSGSHSTDSQIVKWEWKFGDGGQWYEISGGVAQHTYTSAGKFRAQLRVTDDQGRRDTASVVIHVFEGPIIPE
jgi:PKD repeat protein